MFHQKIETRSARPLDRKGSPAKRPMALKLIVGLAVTLLCAVAMVPWTLFVALWGAVALVAVTLRRTGAATRDALVYAGEAVVGR
jgi:membrane protein YdbS with pleckstrin-like domain